MGQFIEVTKIKETVYATLLPILGQTKTLYEVATANKRSCTNFTQMFTEVNNTLKSHDREFEKVFDLKRTLSEVLMRVSKNEATLNSYTMNMDNLFSDCKYQQNEIADKII